jgi:hypothetical protein
MTRPRIGSTLDAKRANAMPAVEPVLVLVLLPVAVGALAEAVFRDAKRASIAAALGAALGVVLAVQALDRNESWSWIAALLVSPIPVALAIATALFWYGRTTKRLRDRGA